MNTQRLLPKNKHHSNNDIKLRNYLTGAPPHTHTHYTHTTHNVTSCSTVSHYATSSSHTTTNITLNFQNTPKVANILGSISHVCPAGGTRHSIQTRGRSVAIHQCTHCFGQPAYIGNDRFLQTRLSKYGACRTG